MRSSTLLALIAVFGPLAVLSSPYYPPEWIEIEIVTISPETARVKNHPPARPATKTSSAHNATITSGTDKKQETVPDECENEDLSSSTTIATGLANAYTGGAGTNSLPTTLSTVADKLRRQESAIPPPATSALDKLRRQDDGSPSSTTSMTAGVSPPDGIVGGTGAYPTPTTMAGSDKKIIVPPCAKGPVKKPVKMLNGQTMITATGGAVVTALGAAASSSTSMSAAASSSTAAM